MDNRYYENVIGEMKPFLDEHKFSLKEDGSFVNGSRSVKISYNEERQMYVLSAAVIEDGETGEYSDIDSWLFDDSQNARDAVAVGVDFTAALRENMGIKIKRVTANGADIELPSASKGGSMTVAGFTKKLLDVFPSLKDEYKDHIAHYGNFLYLNFFGEQVVPKLKAMLSEANKKQIKKLDDVFEYVYIHGDRDAVNAAVAVLCAAAYNDEKVHASIKGMLSENKHFADAFENFLPVLSNNKKLRAALIK